MKLKSVIHLGVGIALLSLPLEVYGVDLAQNFNFDGVLTDNSNNPLTGPVPMTLQIYDPNQTCLLYEESHPTVPLDSIGAFSIKVGSGAPNTAATGGAVPFKKVFSNDGQVRAAGTNCASGYTPATTDDRKLVVTVNGTALTPSYSLSPVPMATVAESLQGKIPSDFIGVAGNITPANISVLVGAGDASTLHHHDGRYSQTGQLNGVTLPAFSAGESMRWDGTGWQSFTPITAETDPTVSIFAKTALPTCAAGDILKSDGTILSCESGSFELGLGSAATKSFGPNPGDLVELDGTGKVPSSLMPITVAMSYGSATSPAYSFSGDTDVGIYLPLTDTLAFSTTGIERMRIKADGSIGIGTISPAAKLHVVGGSIVGDTFDNASNTMINWNQGNVQTSTAACGAFSFSGMVPGGVYKLLLPTPVSSTCTFTQSPLSTRYPTGAGGVTTAGDTVLFTFTVTTNEIFVEYTTF